MSDDSIKVEPGHTVNVTLRRQQKPTQRARARTEELKAALPIDDQTARYIRRPQGRVTIEFFDMGATPVGASPAFVSGGTDSDDYERPIGGFLFGPYVTATGQIALDAALDAASETWPLSSPDGSTQPRTWAGIVTVNGTTVSAENAEANRLTLTVPRGGAGLVVTTSPPHSTD